MLICKLKLAIVRIFTGKKNGQTTNQGFLFPGESILTELPSQFCPVVGSLLVWSLQCGWCHLPWRKQTEVQGTDQAFEVARGCLTMQLDA